MPVNTKRKNMENPNNIQGCDHVQLEGLAFYDERKYFLFSPHEPVPGAVPRMRRMAGVAQQMTDGTFDFAAKPRLRSVAQLIRKLAHGRVSRTKDGAVQVWIKVSPEENVNIGQVVVSEANEAAEAIVNSQLRK